MGKQFFAQYGIPVSDGAATDNVDEAVAIADRIGYPVVIKAQVQSRWARQGRRCEACCECRRGS